MLWPFRDVAQSGRASALGAEGREFESLHPDHIFLAILAQLVEHHTCNVGVASSILADGSTPQISGAHSSRGDNMAEKSAVMVLKEFFGFKPGQSLIEFNEELKQLSASEKAELAQAAAEKLGYTVKAQ